MNMILMTCLFMFLKIQNKEEIPLKNKIEIGDVLGATELVYSYTKKRMENRFMISFDKYPLLEKGINITISSNSSGL